MKKLCNINLFSKHFSTSSILSLPNSPVEGSDVSDIEEIETISNVDDKEDHYQEKIEEYTERNAFLAEAKEVYLRKRNNHNISNEDEERLIFAVDNYINKEGVTDENVTEEDFDESVEINRAKWETYINKLEKLSAIKERIINENQSETESNQDETGSNQGSSGENGYQNGSTESGSQSDFQDSSDMDSSSEPYDYMSED